MTRDELENLIYERTRYFVDVPVADCIFDLIAAEREACAKVCEDLATDLFLKGADEDAAIAEKCAASIWNRSKT